MTSMIERVARAICVHQGFNPDSPLPQQQGEKLAPPWMHYRGPACAAIEAMREPSTRMLCAGANATLGSEDYEWSSEVIWETMIDEALK